MEVPFFWPFPWTAFINLQEMWALKLDLRRLCTEDLPACRAPHPHRVALPLKGPRQDPDQVSTYSHSLFSNQQNLSFRNQKKTRIFSYYADHYLKIFIHTLFN